METALWAALYVVAGLAILYLLVFFGLRWLFPSDRG